MEPKRHRLEARDQERSAEAVTPLTNTSAGREFGTVEELLRHDAAQCVPPERIAERLGESLAAEPGRQGSWWSAWFRRKGAAPGKE